MNIQTHSNNKITIVKVALPIPMRQYFDYIIPQHWDVLPQIGARVKVPFGKKNKLAIAWVISLEQQSFYPTDKLKYLDTLLDDDSYFPAKIMQLIYWISNYYFTSLGMVLKSATPKWIREQTNNIYHKDLMPQLWEITPLGKNIKLNRAPKQQQILNFCKQHSHITKETLTKLGASKTMLISLQKQGYLRLTTTNTWHLASEPKILNTQQQSAYNHILASLNSFKVHLLEGITGSGKTEIYLQLIAQTLACNQQVLWLVPEINLTPQSILSYTQRFGEGVALLHSERSDKQKAIDWLRAQNGQAPVIIGTRSAAFVPLVNLGLIIIDEEHDSSFKQDDGCRYNARDVLIKRAQLESCPIVLGSATPSLESKYNAISNRYQHEILTHRATNFSLPTVKLIDTKQHKLTHGLTKPALQAIKQHLSHNNQVMVFLNKRGYARILACDCCGWRQQCNNCDSCMVIHLHRQQSKCHHCLTAINLLKYCPKCQADLYLLGYGTQQLESFLTQQLPEVNIARIDRDNITKNKSNTIINQLYSGEIQIMIGTQMLAKGHHFPKLTLVLILDCDQALFSADYRSWEYMSQTIIQVAGRAGRETQGMVLIQTAYPQHPIFNVFTYEDLQKWYDKLIVMRRQANLPPFSYQALIRCQAKDITAITTHLTTLKTAIKHQDYELLGPIPAPLMKKSGVYHAQLLLQANTRATLRHAAKLAVNWLEQHTPPQFSWSIDVDPQDMF